MKKNKKDELLSVLLNGGIISGENIAKTIGISRVMVNRYIKDLQKEGFEIETYKGIGYRIATIPDVMYPSLIKSRGGPISEYEILVFDSLPSTNDYCLKNSDTIRNKTVVIAREQTKGRGRLGRSWYSEKDKDITMSIVLKPMVSTDTIIRYSISISLSVVDTLREFDIEEIFIKWPNDIYYNDKKLCGILIESTIQCDTGLVELLVLGIGLNVNSCTSRTIPTATSVYEILGFEVKRATIINKIISNFEENLSLNYDTLFKKWKGNMGLIGKNIIIKSGDEEIKCKFIDVSKSGEIIVEENNKIRKFSFGEVSLSID
ncbi:MAG: biotin--[acetyl-CoA-carboxylase] ligase [Brevinematia bacterium]